MDEALELAKDGMDKAIDRLRKGLTKVRAGPYLRDRDPEYHYYQDRDHDGIVCE